MRCCNVTVCAQKVTHVGLAHRVSEMRRKSDKVMAQVVESSASLATGKIFTRLSS